MKYLFACLLCIFIVYNACAQQEYRIKRNGKKHFVAAKDNDAFAINTLLELQVADWNKGSIEGYMHGYWDSDSLLFIGSKGPRYGYRATLARYKEAYPDAAHMGHLSSTPTSIQRLSDEYYFVVGSWALTRKVGNISGTYTLLLRNIQGKWVIVCDHSS